MHLGLHSLNLIIKVSVIRTENVKCIYFHILSNMDLYNQTAQKSINWKRITVWCGHKICLQQKISVKKVCSLLETRIKYE